MKKNNYPTFTGSPAPRKRSTIVTRRALAVLLSFIVLGAVIILWRDNIKPVGAASRAQKSQASPGNLWQAIDETALLANQRQREPRLRSYRAMRLNRDALTTLLDQAPMELTETAKDTNVEITLPMPDGTFARFRIEESPVIEPGLATQFPEIKTYRGYGIDNPTATVRFDRTPGGFHAIVLSEHGTVYVRPYALGDDGHYISFHAHDYQTEARYSDCSVAETGGVPDASAPQLMALRNQLAANFQSNSLLRTYRLAVAATADYTAQFREPGDTDAQAKSRTFSKIITMVNSVNAIFERDLYVHLNLVSGTSIIFTDPNTDGYTNGNRDAMLDENQTKLDSVIGSGNYDIGHVFGTDSGGVGAIGSVCKWDAANPDERRKGKGVTGAANPDDPYDVRLVAHEFGHQFGASHSFNATADGCGSNGRWEPSAYEPGSGSTIMSYARGCGIQNLQNNRDDYFHAKSIEEIFNNLAVNGSCATQSSTGNNRPSISIGSNFTIPQRTPFKLTGYASDANGDALTYCWEEYDEGVAPPPDAYVDGYSTPLFRSYSPSSSNSRVFPSWDYIRNNANVPPLTRIDGTNTYMVGEALPASARTMNFMLTVRDGRGGVSSALKQITVASGSTATGPVGPFVVTEPNAPEVWLAGSTQTVRWDVANTGALSSRVNILLSTDGGYIFPYTLATGTPNDGAEAVTIPSGLNTGAARIIVEAADNIFFDMSDSNFTICAPVAITAQPVSQTVCATAPVSFSATATGDNLSYQWRKNGANIPNATGSTYLIAAVSASDAGSYSVVVSNNCNTVTSSNASLTVTSLPAIVSQPVSVTKCQGQPVTFAVTATGTNIRYQWRKNGGNIPGATSSSYTIASVSMSDAGSYSVVVFNGCSTVNSGNATLTVNSPISITSQPASVTKSPGQSATFVVTATGTNLHYQWRKNGGNIAGATNSGYTIASVSAGDAGSYSVVVFNGCSTVNSAAANLTVSTATATNNADFVIQTPPPTTMTAGLRYNVSIKMRNTGTSTWTVAGGYYLQAQRPAGGTTWGISQVALPASVAPGGEVTFNFTITAPAPGDYVFEWGMAQNGVGFGGYSPALPVTVTR